MRLTITFKLAAAFAAVAALTLMLGVFGLSRTSALKNDTVTVAERLVPAAETVGLLKEETGKYRRNQLIFATGAQDLDDVKAELEGSVEAVPGIAETYRNLTFDQGARDALAGFEEAWTTYLDTTAGMEKLGRAARHDEALAVLTQNEGDATWGALKDSLIALDDANQKTAHAVATGAGDRADSARTVTWVLLGLALLIAVALAVIVIRSIRRGLASLIAAARGIARGDVEHEIDTTGRDEMGDTAREFAEMVGYLRESAEAADRIAGGDLTVDVEPRSERDPLGNALQHAARVCSTVSTPSSAGIAGAISRESAVSRVVDWRLSQLVRGDEGPVQPSARSYRKPSMKKQSVPPGLWSHMVVVSTPYLVPSGATSSR